MRNLKNVKPESHEIVELINELTSLKPNHVQIKKCCDAVGITYKKNVIDLMSDILMLSSSQKSKISETKTLNKVFNKEI